MEITDPESPQFLLQGVRLTLPGTFYRMLPLFAFVTNSVVAPALLSSSSTPAFSNHVGFVMCVAGAILETAAERAMKSLGCSVADIGDILNSEPFGAVLSQIGCIISVTLHNVKSLNQRDKKPAAASPATGNPELALLESVIKTTLDDTQKIIEAAFPEARRKKAQRLAADNTNRPFKDAKEYCIQTAKDAWKANPDIRTGDMIDGLCADLKRQGRTRHPRTVRGWLTAADTQGLLTIPPSARNPGRPTE